MPEILEKNEVLKSDLVADPPRFLAILIIVAKRKYFILKTVGATVVLSLIVAFLWPKTYTASARIMPIQANQPLNMSAILSQLGPLAAAAGNGSGLIRNQSDLDVSMLKSRVIADDLIDRFSLMSIYGKKYRVDARRKLADRSEILAEKNGIVSISVEDRDPQRAAALANAYVDELDKLSRTLAITEASRRRLFFEREVKKAGDELAASEMALKETQEKTGLIFLDSQSKAMIEMVSNLRAQVSAHEAQVQVMRLFATPENADLIRAEQELAALRAQLAKVENGPGAKKVGDVSLENAPTAGLEYIRKFRDVKYHEALYELLLKQYEMARIDEGRDSLVVQTLDTATPPEKHSSPDRPLWVLSATLLALALALLVVFLTEAFERARANPEFSDQVRLLRFYLSHKV